MDELILAYVGTDVSAELANESGFHWRRVSRGAVLLAADPVRWFAFTLVNV
jgi:hypothetical protein